MHKFTLMTLLHNNNNNNKTSFLIVYKKNFFFLITTNLQTNTTNKTFDRRKINKYKTIVWYEKNKTKQLNNQPVYVTR